MMLSFYSTADEIQSSGSDTAILPIGSTEQHGPHLPVATDCIIVSAVAEKVAEKLGAYLLPTLPISTCREHMGKRGSVWMNPDTFYHMLEDIVSCLKEQGFKRVIVMLGHGGIFIAAPAIRQINATQTDIKVIKIDFMQAFEHPEMQAILECKNNIHACEYETSLMLYLKEELVRKERIADSLPQVPRDYLNYGSIFNYSTNGVWGAPSLATREKGAKIFKILIDTSIQYINEVSEFFKEKRGYSNE